MTEIREGKNDLVYAAIRTVRLPRREAAIELTIPVFVIFTIETGLIAQIDVFFNRHAALEAAGLPE